MTPRLIVLVVGLSVATIGRGDIALPQAHVGRFALADVLVVGRVIAIEPQDIELPAVPGGTKVKFRVAVVNVTENIHGKKEAKTLRVGFVPVAEPEPPLRRRYPMFNFKLGVGDQGLLILRKHPTENLLVGSTHFDFVPYEDDKSTQPPVERWGRASYASELNQARRVGKIIEAPLSALRDKEQPERFVAACQLLMRYRTPVDPGAKAEAIPQEESNLILTALLEHDWKLIPQAPSAWDSFRTLGLTEKDGWKAPVQINNANDLRSAAQAWHRDHGQGYRIQRFVRGTAK
jgi:hypothetical protein